MPVALITGATRGLGREITRSLSSRDWTLVLDARTPVPGLSDLVVGDVADPAHRAALLAEVRRYGRLDLLVNNASTLGPGIRPLSGYPLDALRRVLEVDLLAPLALVQDMLTLLQASAGAIIDLTSDAAVQAYAGWGAYGAAKAALDQVTAVLAVEHPEVRCYALDPGDMRTDLHQQAFPDEDISDRPEPATVVPAVLRLVDERPPSGRYRAADLLAVPA